MVEDNIFQAMQNAALDAGKVIMHYYNHGFEVREKQDCSPVSEADVQAELIILKALHGIAPHIPVIAEERMSCGGSVPALGHCFFLVDPLDGTREFINKNGEFSVNIALIKDGVPIAGVIYQPTAKTLFFGNHKGAFKAKVSDAMQINAWKIGLWKMSTCEQIYSRLCAVPPVALLSRSHCLKQTIDWLDKRGFQQNTIKMGSSLKFCALAEGKADIYPRFERCMEWDTAAGDALLRASGGIVIGFDGEPLIYGQHEAQSINDFAQKNFIAFGEKSNSLKPEWRHL